MPDQPKTPSPDEDDVEILDTGQEEVFSRTEVELGQIEHSTEAGRKDHPADATGSGASKGSAPP